MPPQGCIFTLPLEHESDEVAVSDETNLLNEDVEKNGNPKIEGQVERQNAQKLPRLHLITFTWRMIRWHIIWFVVLFAALFAGFHFGLDKKNKEVVMQALVFCYDWRQLAFFLGIYISFSVKKISDVTSVSYRTLKFHVSQCD